MTNWEKIEDSMKVLFPKADKQTVVNILAAGTDYMCAHCAIYEQCFREMFMHDENGKPLYKANGDLINNDSYPGCDQMLLRYLDSESN